MSTSNNNIFNYSHLDFATSFPLHISDIKRLPYFLGSTFYNIQRQIEKYVEHNIQFANGIVKIPSVHTGEWKATSSNHEEMLLGILMTLTEEQGKSTNPQPPTAKKIPHTAKNG